MKTVFSASKAIHEELKVRGNVPEEGLRAETNQILSVSLTRNTRGYIEKIANQINGCYERGWFDSCAVMIRRLVETLIVEAFEAQNIAQKIKDDNGDFLFLKDLINLALSEPSWNLTRNAKKSLPQLKEVGDKSAHSRRYIANKQDIDKISGDLRTVVQELLFLANLK